MTVLIIFLILVINCHCRYTEPSLMLLICLFCPPNRPGLVNCSFCDNIIIMNVSFPLYTYLEQLIHLIWLFGWSADWLIDWLCIFMHSAGWQTTWRWLHSISHSVLTPALDQTLHSLWSTFTVESFSCLLRCPGDPVLIRSMRHREPMQQSCWKNKGKTTSNTDLLCPHLGKAL